MKQYIKILSLVLVVFLLPLSASAQEKLHAAVAANFIQAFQSISSAFEQKTGIKVEATFSSTGNLYAQITNGAPYDLMLSADENRPARLYKDGIAEKPFVYAKGQSVLWSARKEFCRAKTWQEALKAEDIKKISMANPEIAPYGASARVALQKTGIWQSLEKKLIMSQDIAQAFQYASTEATDAGFCALSAAKSPAGEKGCYYIVSEAPEVIQSACILKRTKNPAAAERFAAFLLETESQGIKDKLGYK